jgi:hypothetical protein
MRWAGHVVILPDHADDYLLGENINMTKMEATIDGSEEADLEVNADKTKYVSMSRH